MTKTELRLLYKKLRKQLSNADIEEKSLAIANGVLALDLWDKTYFHIFLPIEEQKEVNTEFLLHLLSGKDKEIVVSKSDFTTRKMTHFLLTDNTKIKKNEYNIPEPIDGIEVPSSKIQVVFVPLLAFDLNGNRVGTAKDFTINFWQNAIQIPLKLDFRFLKLKNQLLMFLKTMFVWIIALLQKSVTPFNLS